MTESLSQPPISVQTPSGDSSEDAATDALAHLAKMSGTGSAFGVNEYVALSPVAIVALLLGFASALSMIVSLLLFIPVAGILLGFLSLRQIRNSNGTQGGIGFAIGGIILSLLIGGGVTAKQVMAAARAKADSRQCADVLEKLGEEIRAQRYDAIYNNMTTDFFRSMVPPKLFNDVLPGVRINPAFGELKTIRWAGNAIHFEPVAGTDAKFAYAMMLLQFDKAPDAFREMVKLTDRDGGWKIEALPQLFPDQKKNPTGFNKRSATSE